MREGIPEAISVIGTEAPRKDSRKKTCRHL